MSEWAIQCTRFNHDRLKNQFLQSVVRVVRVLEGRTLDQEFVDNFVDRLLSIWDELETEAAELLDRAESETGPSAWFRTYPLSRLCHEDRLWMEALLTGEWQVCFDTQGAVKNARDAISDVGAQCQKLEKAFRSLLLDECRGTTTNECCKTDSVNGELLGYAVGLYRSCQHLSEALQKLSPNDPIQALAMLDKVRYA